MAKLINCKSCNQSISKQAKTCPNCGAPNKQTSIVTWAAGLMFAFVIFNMFFLSDNSSNVNNRKATQKVEKSIVADQSDSAQLKRKELIAKLTNSGIFYKIEVPAELPHLFVTDEFMSLSFDDKQSFAGVVLAYHHTINNKVDIVVLKDYRNNEKVGTISKSGLRLD